MKNKTTNDKFHGMTIISDHDCVSVKGQNVIELNSSCDLVCRYYDNNGLEEDEPFLINISDFGTNPSESNITGSIKRQLGIHKLLISESAVDLIKQYASI